MSRRRRPTFGTVEQLNSGRWRARYPHLGKRWNMPTLYSDERLARDALHRVWLDIQTGQWVDPTIKEPEPELPPTFAEVLEQYIAHRVGNRDLRGQTADDYRGVAALWLGCGDPPSGFGAKRIDEITRDDCNRVIATSRKKGKNGKGHKPGTTKNIARIMNAVMNFAVSEGELRTTNPAHRLNVPKPERKVDEAPGSKMVCLTYQQVLDLADSFDHTPYRTLIRLTVFGGALRAGEVEGLRVRDFDPFAKTITVARRIREGVEDVPKSDASMRTNMLDDDLAAEVAALCAGRSPDDSMFLTPTGHAHRHDGFYKREFLPAVERLGLRMRFHDLRHSGISLLLAAGVPVVDVAAWCGHSTPSVTLSIYAHVVPDQHDRPARAFAAMRADLADNRLRAVS